jgi:hypothetical protein
LRTNIIKLPNFGGSRKQPLMDLPATAPGHGRIRQVVAAACRYDARIGAQQRHPNSANLQRHCSIAGFSAGSAKQDGHTPPFPAGPAGIAHVSGKIIVNGNAVVSVNGLAPRKPI